MNGPVKSDNAGEWYYSPPLVGMDIMESIISIWMDPEDGDRALAFALKSVYGFSGFKESVGCYMDDLNKACADIQRITGVKPAGA